MKPADYWIKILELQKHPEGGWFREIYRSEEIAPLIGLPGNFSGARNFATSIYYLLEGNDFSSFHRIKSDEIWHFYTGSSAVEIWSIQNGKLKKEKLGSDFENDESFQIVVPKNTWFAAHLFNKNGYALAGCTVSPGFHFEDFEMADQMILNEFPEIADEIKTRIKK